MAGADARATILVIEDDASLRSMYRDLLTEEGYRMVGRADAPAEIAEIAALAPDLILLDLWLGAESSGATLPRRLKVDPRTADIPVLICTAALHDLDALRAEFVELGCAVLTKPFDLDDLLAMIAACLAPEQELSASG